MTVHAMLALGSRLEVLLRWLIATGFAVMVVAAIVQVLARYAFNSPLGWTEELARIAMLWWTFLAVGLLACSRKLMVLEALLFVLPGRAAHGVMAMANLVSGVFAIWLTWLGIRLVRLAGTQVTPALDILYAWIYLSLPVGLGIASAGFVVNFAIDLKNMHAGKPVVRIGAEA